MKRLMLILPLIALTGCASNVALKDDSNSTKAVGTLKLTWLAPHSIEVTLDGVRYEGKWNIERCTTFSDCPTTYGLVGKYHRRHLAKGKSQLKSKDGDRIDCEWISHLPDVQGTCRAQDGRMFKLVEAKPAK